MAQYPDEQPTFEDLEILAEVSQLLTVVDLDRVMHEVIRLAARAVGASKVSLFLQEGNQVDWEHLITMRDLSQDESFTVVTRVLDEGFAGWVFRHKRGDVIEDTHTDKRWIIFPDDPPNQRSAMCVPFMNQSGEVQAVITLVHEDIGHFKQMHLRLMTIIANQATIALRNAQLFNTLNAERRQLQAIMQAMSDVLIALDERGHIIRLNQAALPVLNLATVEEGLGHHIGEFLLVDDVFEAIVAIVEAEIFEQDQWEFDVRSERRKIDYDVTMSIWQDQARGTAGFVIVMHDVTQLYDLSRFKDEMLRVASHDLRSPLALIAGYADVASLDTPDEASPVHQYMDVIKNTTEKMGTLVDDLLRVEQIRSSPLELHEKIDLNALVKVVLVNMKPLVAAANLEFLTEIQLDKVPRISADPVLLRQSMENLISNAAKYTPQGEVIVRAYVDENRFHFQVEDTGIGIAEEHQPFIFESFYRVNTARVVKGNGLGLSLVKSVIQRHDGEVWVKSQPGVGSRFGFWLPMR